MKLKETDLYQPIKSYLENQKYEISSEVHNCDMVARRGEEIIIVELKTRFSLDLVYQAVRRLELADSVYVAVPLLPGKKNIHRYRDIRILLRRLGVGLILVRFMKTKTRVEVLLHPGEYTKRKQHNRRLAIVREIDARYSEFNSAGSVSSAVHFSAYRQRALLLAWLLKKHGVSSPAQLKKMGGAQQCQNILSQNFYGWFEKIKRGVYGLSDAGESILHKYKKQIDIIVQEKGM